MAEDCHSGAMPNVVTKDFLSESTEKLGTETVQPLTRQADEDVNLHIPDEQLSIKSDDAASNRQSINVSPGDFDTYAITCICKDDSTCMMKSLEETATTIVASNSSHNDDMNLARCDSSKHEYDTSVFIRNDSHAHTETGDPMPVYTQSTSNLPPNEVNPNPTYTQSIMKPPPNDDNPNPMYLQSTMEPIVSPGQAFKPNNSNDNNYTQPSVATRRQDNDVIFMSANSDGNSCLQPYAVTKLQDDEKESVVEEANNEDNPCIQPYAVRYQGNDEHSLGPVECGVIQPYAVRYEENDVTALSDITTENGQTDRTASDDVDIKPYAVAYMERDDKACDTTSGDSHTHTGQSLQKPTTASKSINDVLANPSSNDTNPTDLVSEERQHIPDALIPNPMYVPNVQHPPLCAGRDIGYLLYLWSDWMLQFCLQTAGSDQQLTR
uniref:Uncharacterized protein n=1 Tax=Branchiostoma floridae TaxID=7739 RepID=C3Z311_BRAFL|eukprot:XP_002597038.1 hypothetical protein BRAFLDRAFT_96187 [Branchiostoma floridae]